MIVVIGSINMDLVLRVPRMPLPGETLAGGAFATIAGGKGANQAVAAARLGHVPVAMVGCVGDDGFGLTLRAALKADGIDERHVSTMAGTATGVASILVDANGQNSIVIAAGANDLLSPAHIDAARDVIEQAAIVVLQLEVPLATVRHAIGLANRLGKPVLLNPAPAQDVPPELLAMVTYLVPNEIEAAMLASANSERGASVAGSDAAVEAAAARLLAMGCAHVLITLGADGVYEANAADRRQYPAERVQAVDTTAAGDTFIGGFVAALAGGAAQPDAIAYGQRAAAWSVTHTGAQTSIPYKRQLDAL